MSREIIWIIKWISLRESLKKKVFKLGGKIVGPKKMHPDTFSMDSRDYEGTNFFSWKVYSR